MKLVPSMVFLTYSMTCCKSTLVMVVVKFLKASTGHMPPARSASASASPSRVSLESSLSILDVMDSERWPLLALRWISRGTFVLFGSNPCGIAHWHHSPLLLIDDANLFPHRILVWWGGDRWVHEMASDMNRPVFLCFTFQNRQSPDRGKPFQCSS